MFRFEPGEGRESLGFQEQALSAFAFLEHKFNFRCVKGEATFVRYESAGVFVNVFHGRGSYTLGVELGPLVNGGAVADVFSLGELLKLAEGERDPAQGRLHASTADGVRRGLPKLAELFERVADPILRGDPASFSRLRQQQEAESNKFLDDLRATDVRVKAAKAWESRDYPETARLLEQIENQLGPAERRKLEIARKRS